MRVGTRRAPTREELGDARNLSRANAVVALRSIGRAVMTPNESRVAALADGRRPIARIRLKSGLTPAEFRDALRGLARKDLLSLVALIEDARSELRGLKDEASGDSVEDEETKDGVGDTISSAVMVEIAAMIEEESRSAAILVADDDVPTDVMRPRPKTRKR